MHPSLKQEFKLNFVSLKKLSVGAKIEGYLGGVYINKFEKPAMTLYMRQLNKQWCCQAVPYCSDLQAKVPEDAVYVVLTYRGMVQEKKFSRHDFDVEVKEVADSPALQEFLAKIRDDTAKKDTAPVDKKNDAMAALDSLSEELPF